MLDGEPGKLNSPGSPSSSTLVVMFKQNFQPAWTLWDALFLVVLDTITVPKLGFSPPRAGPSPSAQAAVSAKVACARRPGGGVTGWVGRGRESGTAGRRVARRVERWPAHGP